MSKAAKAAKRVGGGNLGTVGTLALVKLKAANGGMLGALRVFVQTCGKCRGTLECRSNTDRRNCEGSLDLGVL